MPYAVNVRRRYVLYFDGSGVLKFTASPDHATVTNYAIRLYAYGTTSPLVTARDIGVPTPDQNNDIVHDCRTMFTALSPGNYTAQILTTTPLGSAETTAGASFSIPLL